MSLTFGRKNKNTVPGISSAQLIESYNVKSTDSLLIAPDLASIKQNITDATGKTNEDIFDYPIKNTILEMKNNQGESLMGSFNYAIVPKADIKKK